MRLVADPQRPGRALLLPFGAEVGAAAFRRGGAAMLVFDTARPLDLSALAGDSSFGGAEARITGDATVLRLPLAALGRLVPRLAPEHGNAWLVEIRREAAEPPPRPLAPEVETEPMRLVIRAARPGRTVALADPETGAPLLVGTLREPGQGMRHFRRGAQFELLPSTLGVVVLARSDALVLRSGLDRFTLSAAGGAELVLGDAWHAPPSAAEAARMTRVLDLPVATAGPALLERLRSLQGSIVATAPLARAPLRREAAEVLLALGLAQEAQAMSALAFQEDPRTRDDPRLLLAHGAAALLVGRLPEAARAIEDRRLPETDETLLWRGLLAAALLLSYPEALQARLIPPAAEALLDAGGTAALAAAGRLIEEAAAPETPRLALARARLAEAEGRTGEALAAYDALALGRDRLARARAIHRAVALRLANGALDPGAAAAALEAALFAWRGDAIEVEARLRLVELKRRTGDAAGAVELLRETAAQYPAQAAALQPRLREALLAALAEAPPLTAVALAEANRTLLPETGEAGLAAVMLLADRLVALDLPDRAASLLRAAATRGVAEPQARAALGARLAALRLGEGDAAGALAALDSTEGADLPQHLATERDLLRARALARAGNREAAVLLLRRLGAAGAAVLAELLAESQDWQGAAAALEAHLEATLPAPPAPLAPEQRRALARLAAYTALAGDEARLAALRAAHRARMHDGPLSEAFELLTTGPLRDLDDLPRLRRELGAIRSLTSRLEPLRAGGPAAR
ncbi:MAG: hypothetical protein IRZ13_04395 [Acetobacteraceae bacterium]|nr:hypothetical protein [Acetobacteraceae bacterium]